jgi:hypothetical protein
VPEVLAYTPREGVSRDDNAVFVTLSSEYMDAEPLVCNFCSMAPVAAEFISYTDTNAAMYKCVPPKVGVAHAVTFDVSYNGKTLTAEKGWSYEYTNRVESYDMIENGVQVTLNAGVSTRSSATCRFSTLAGDVFTSEPTFTSTTTLECMGPALNGSRRRAADQDVITFQFLVDDVPVPDESGNGVAYEPLVPEPVSPESSESQEPEISDESPEANVPEQNLEGGLDEGIVFGIILGAFCLLLVISAVIYMCCASRCSRVQEKPVTDTVYSDVQMAHVATPVRTPMRASHSAVSI